MTKGGIGYEAECCECKRQGKISLYHGETSRTLYTRATEHLARDSGENGEESKKALLKHTAAFHPGKEPNFNIKVTGSFNDPLTRHINEGVRINNSRSNAGYLMNSKSEYRQGEVPRVVVTRGLQA